MSFLMRSDRITAGSPFGLPCLRFFEDDDVAADDVGAGDELSLLSSFS